MSNTPTKTVIRDNEGNIVQHPYDRGYWARVVRLPRTISRSKQFQSGWDQADDELREEAAEKQRHL